MSEPVIIMPAIALRGTTILPGMVVHFDISRKRSMKAIEAAMGLRPEDFSGDTEKFQAGNTRTPGFISDRNDRLCKTSSASQNLLRVLVEGTEKVDLLALDQEEPYLKAEVSMIRQEEEELHVNR